MKNLEVTFDLKWGDRGDIQYKYLHIEKVWAGRKMLGYLCLQEEVWALPSIHQCGCISSHQNRRINSFIFIPPPVGSTSVAMRWEIENEGCRKLPSCSSRGSSTWREFYEPQVSNTFNTLKLLEPTVLNAISLEMFILPVVWLPVLWPCPCTADWRHSGFKQSGLDWSLLVFRISRQNKTCLSGVWNMTGCFWWIVSVHLEWRGWVLAKQKYFKYLI